MNIRRLTLVPLFALLLASCSKEPPAPPQMPPPEVTVANPLQKTLMEWDEYTGRFEAAERVEIRARVSGYLEEIRFKDGEKVSKGQILYVIDQRPFKIALERATAQHELAEKELKRLQGLSASRAVSKEDLDIGIQDVIVAKSFLDEARLNLEFTQVKSPIDGRISRSRLDVGNLVNSNDTQPLTTVVSITPIHFYLEASEQALLKYIRLDQSGQRRGTRDNPRELYVRLADEETYNMVGIVDFVDVELDRGTGTVQARAIYDNSNEVLYPGLFGRARIAGSGEYMASLVPDHIIGTDQSKKFVLVVDEDNKVAMKFVTLGPLTDSGMRIIREGLEGNEKVVINGLQRARPGMTVATVTGEIEDLPLFNMPELSVSQALLDAANLPADQVQNSPQEAVQE